MTRGEGRGRLGDEMRRCYGPTLENRGGPSGNANATATPKCKRDSSLRLRVTAHGEADRSAQVRHNANREIGVPGGDAVARGSCDRRECLTAKRRSRSLTHPRFARMGSG